MFQKIKDFFTKPMFFKNIWVEWGVTLAAIGGTLAYIFHVNDFSRPPIPEADKPQDFTTDIAKLDPKKPIGIFAFNVHSDEAWGSKLTVNTSRNNFIEKMQEHYGDNLLVLDCPSKLHFENCSKQFNEHFAGTKPVVHFLASHHTPHYDKKDPYNNELAKFIKSIDAKEKRATILSCGPAAEIYKDVGCEYVIIPRANGEILGPEIDLEFSPAYRETIGWMAEISDPEVIRKKLTENNIENIVHSLRDNAINTAVNIYYGENIEARKDPVVVVPPQNLPPKPKQNTQSPNP